MALIDTPNINTPTVVEYVSVIPARIESVTVIEYVTVIPSTNTGAGSPQADTGQVYPNKVQESRT